MISSVLILVVASVCGAAASDSLEERLARAGDPAQVGETVESDAARRAAYIALEALCAMVRETGEEARLEHTARLVTALHDPLPTMRRAAARVLVVRPDVDTVPVLLDALDRESSVPVRRVLVNCVADALKRLDLPDHDPQLVAAASAFEGTIRDSTTDAEVRSAAMAGLGRLGPVAMPALLRFAQDSRWGSAFHSQLPAAFAATGDPAAVDEILALYDGDPAEGFRAGCLHALMTLLKETQPDDPVTAQRAADALRTIALHTPNASLAAVASRAYSCVDGCHADIEFVTFVRTHVATSQGRARKNYLRALLGLGLPLDAQTKTAVESIRDSATASAAERKVANAILLNDTE
jgi:HEAT repeat protein